MAKQFPFSIQFPSSSSRFCPLLSVWKVAPCGYTKQPEGWREGEGLTPKAGSSQQITQVISDTNGLSYSNYGNWEAVSFNRYPILIQPMCGIHIQVLTTVRKKKEGEKKGGLLLLLFSSKNNFFAIILKKAIVHHGYLYTCTSLGKIF